MEFLNAIHRSLMLFIYSLSTNTILHFILQEEFYFIFHSLETFRKILVSLILFQKIPLWLETTKNQRMSWQFWSSQSEEILLISCDATLVKHFPVQHFFSLLVVLFSRNKPLEIWCSLYFCRKFQISDQPTFPSPVMLLDKSRNLTVLFV